AVADARASRSRIRAVLSPPLYALSFVQAGGGGVRVSPDRAAEGARPVQLRGRALGGPHPTLSPELDHPGCGDHVAPGVDLDSRRLRALAPGVSRKERPSRSHRRDDDGAGGSDHYPELP